MKTLCTVTVTLLLSLLCVVLPREVWAMENAMLEQIKSAADAAVERMKVLQTKEAKTDEQKQLARELLIYAKANAEAASVLLRLPSPEGGGISQEQAENMQKIGSLSRAVLKTAAVIAQGDTVTAGQDLDKLAAMMDGLLVLEEDTITLEEMLAIKAAADEAVEEAKLRLEQATTPEERELAEQLLAYAELYAELAAVFLQTLLEGGSVARNLAEECAAAAQAVKEGTAAMAAGDFSRARAVVDTIAGMTRNLLTVGNKNFLPMRMSPLRWDRINPILIIKIIIDNICIGWEWVEIIDRKTNPSPPPDFIEHTIGYRKFCFRLGKPSR